MHEDEIPKEQPTQDREPEPSISRDSGKKKILAVALIVTVLAVSLAAVFLFLFPKTPLTIDGIQLQILGVNKQDTYTDEARPTRTTYWANSINDTLLVIKARWLSAVWNEELPDKIMRWDATVTDETWRTSDALFLSVSNNGDVIWLFSVTETSHSFTLNLSNQTIRLTL